MSTFEVDAETARVRIGMDHHGRVRFRATNTSAREIRGTAHVKALGDSAPSWFAIDGDVQREFPPGAPQDFDVIIQVPSSAPDGEHEFRLEVIGVELPDEDVGESAAVAIVVSAPPPPAKSKGYVVAVIGAFAGAVVGVIIGTLPGMLVLIALEHQVVTTSGTNIAQAVTQAFVDALAVALVAAILIFLGVVIGVWVGPVLGALVALRIRAAASIGMTVGLLAAFQPIVTIVLIALLILIGQKVTGTAAVIAILAVFALVDFVVPAVLARAATRLIRVRSL